jgi:endonuclease III
MKNVTKHVEKLKSLMRGLLRDFKSTPISQQEPLKALVRGAMSYDVPDTRAEEAMRHIEAEFVDLNELRVATELEVQELLGTRYHLIERRVEMITRGLNAIFEREHTLSLDRLRTISKRDARQFLRELPDIHSFVEAYVMLYAFDGHAMPLDEPMRQYLVEEDALDKNLSLADAQKFIEHHIKAEECHDLFVALRRAVYEDSRSKKKARA